MSVAADLIRSEGQEVARCVIVAYLRDAGGIMPLVAALGTAHSMGLEEGLALALHHPELGRRLLEAIDREGYAESGAPPGAVAEQRAQFLIRMVEGLNR